MLIFEEQQNIRRKNRIKQWENKTIPLSSTSFVHRFYSKERTILQRRIKWIWKTAISSHLYRLINKNDDDDILRHRHSFDSQSQRQVYRLESLLWREAQWCHWADRRIAQWRKTMYWRTTRSPRSVIATELQVFQHRRRQQPTSVTKEQVVRIEYSKNRQVFTWTSLNIAKAEAVHCLYRVANTFIN